MRMNPEHIRKMKDFFYQHPINSFDYKIIADYLEIDEETVKELLLDMWKFGLVRAEWRASKQFISNEMMIRGYTEEEDDE